MFADVCQYLPVFVSLPTIFINVFKIQLLVYQQSTVFGYRYFGEPKFVLTWNVVLVGGSVSAAEAGDAAGDDDHQDDGHAAHDQQQLQVDLKLNVH
jgi:hypothetical protein